MDEQTQIYLELNVAEINVILRSLGKHPFEEIAALIGKIKAQGENQLKELQESNPVPPASETEEDPKGE